MPTATLDVASLSLVDTHISALENLPLGVLYIVFSNLDTAQSLARLSLASKRLHRAVRTTGYRAFVITHFRSLTLQRGLKDEQWAGLARRLTWQSRAWDRRAFSVASAAPPAKQSQVNGRGRRVTSRRGQSFPPQVVVDARARIHGQVEHETVAWGIGEDVVVRWRDLRRSELKKDKWKAIEGAKLGFSAGDDDVTAVAIVGDSTSFSGLLVGRASGGLHLLSTAQEKFGEMQASFEPSGTELRQSQVQHFDVNAAQDTLAAITKDGVLLYPLDGTLKDDNLEDASAVSTIAPTETLNLRAVERSAEFRSLRQAKFLPNGDLAVCMNGSKEPLRHIQRTQTGMVVANAAKMNPSSRCHESLIYNGERLQNARALLPVNTSSTAGGSGYTILSSYDDGAVRLQDLRTPSAIDTIYQDHFEILTPIGPLVSHGTERFIAGCARTAILKIFDFRWTRPYSYTDALACSDQPLVPTPKPLTLNPAPRATDCGQCVFLSGHKCARHTLARTDFYRPNCNMYLPTINPNDTPVYSLAKSSDLSATVYAGLTSELAEVSIHDPTEVKGRGFSTLKMGKHRRCGYDYAEQATSIVETGDGLALSDVAESRRMPQMYRQKGQRVIARGREPRRLDDLLL